ncbi:DUF4238 domain-containing protein [Salinivibrio sp. VYel6]|uniref:DUF4238 domain-containing protein n=1 Tax=Salinivibrio sp. VYel6 TaxID=2490493 RepID=UPI00128E877E|nr:DUF4238 domain-containing protein [Salinivibrio sp. VYel6]MPX97881.1 DUF4238 domain-containing protein [Salinivibrio sp. VYel6]
MKKEEIKRKHHYVWAKYMKEWSSNGRDVFYNTKNRKTVQKDSVRGLNMEKDFYMITPLSKEQVGVIKTISKLNPALHEQHMEELSSFLAMQVYIESKTRINPDEKENNKTWNKWQSNQMENFHAHYENKALPIITRLKKTDLSILESKENSLNFMIFLGLQHMRTKKIKDTIKNIKNKEHFKDIEKCWWFLSYMLGKNIGTSLFSKMNLDNHSLLVNTSSTPFITSDQPVINSHNSVCGKMKEPQEEELDLYYPLSPDLAYIITRSKRFTSGVVSTGGEVADEMNRKIAMEANHHIIGSTKEAVDAYKKYVTASG